MSHPKNNGTDQSIFEIMSVLAAQHGAVNLGQGIPDDAAPEAVLTAAAAAMREGRNQYSPSPGLPELRREIALSTGLSGLYDPMTEVTVVAGCGEALATIFLALASPGDEALVFEPYYNFYPAIAGMAHVRLAPVLLADDGKTFHLNMEALERAITPRSRFLILNTPHNPTGHVFDEGELAEIAAFAAAYDLTVICDEVYERFTYDTPHRSLAALPGMRERVIVASSASKSFNVTGWRIGWLLADAAISCRLREVHACLTFCAPTPLQAGIAEGLRWARESSYFEDLRACYRRRGDRLFGHLLAAGFDPIRPQGAYFILARTGRWHPSDIMDFSRDLTIDGGVTPLPMATFFSSREAKPHYLRFAFCRRPATLEEAGRRLLAYARQRLE